MTDIEELVKRMRGLAEYVDDCDEAADALEAQAKEIRIYQQTELTYITRVADAQREYSEMQAKLKARIAELEAALDHMHKGHDALVEYIAELETTLKPFADEKHVDRLPDWTDGGAVVGCDIQVRDLRAARAKLNGREGKN